MGPPRSRQSSGAVDCAVDQERRGIYAEPFARPGRSAERRVLRRVRRYVRRCIDRNSRSGMLPHLHTANTARDLNRLRAAVGDSKLSYLGYSYGTQIGATYATLFPQRVRALVLDGAVDVEGFVDHPIRDSRRQAQAFEQALGRFFAACRARQDRCGLGASPRAAYRALARKLDRAVPLPAFGPSASSVDGDDLRAATLLGLNQKQLWPALEGALVEARTGDGSLLRTFADVFFEREGPSVLDPYVAIYALDGRWRARAPHLRDGRSAYRRFDHFWWAAGYARSRSGSGRSSPSGPTSAPSATRERHPPRSWWAPPTTPRPPTCGRSG